MQEGEKWLRACKLVLGLHVDYQYRFMRFEQQSEEAAAHNEAEYTAGVGACQCPHQKGNYRRRHIIPHKRKVFLTPRACKR